jgi:hypothetical protein
LLAPYRVPVAASLGGPPEALWGQMGMNIDAAHSVLLHDPRHRAGHALSIREFSRGLNGRKRTLETAVPPAWARRYAMLH